MKVYRQWVPCKPNPLHNFIPIFMKLCTSFFPFLLFNPAVNFCHFSTLLTLSFFNLFFRWCDINFTDVRSIFYIILYIIISVVRSRMRGLDRARDGMTIVLLNDSER